MSLKSNTSSSSSSSDNGADSILSNIAPRTISHHDGFFLPLSNHMFRVVVNFANNTLNLEIILMSSDRGVFVVVNPHSFLSLLIVGTITGC